VYKLRLSYCVTSLAFRNLTFPQRVHCLVPGDGVPCATKGSKMLLGARPSLNASMVLLYQIVF
jgi:hypothetical protein